MSTLLFIGIALFGFILFLFYISQEIPSGTIVMWTGETAPKGWVLCDGTNGTPNLSGRFILSMGGSYPYASTGGEATHTLTATEIPSHTHTGTTVSNGAHAHSITDPGHTHSITDPGHTHSQTTINDDFNNSGDNPPGFTGDSAGSVTWNNINSSTTGISVNSNSTGVSVNSNGAHTHTFTSDSTGGGAAHNNMPPYYVLAYIMKV
jgi:microcystin-dependent protein